jgi:hypothetical protein
VGAWKGGCGPQASASLSRPIFRRIAGGRLHVARLAGMRAAAERQLLQRDPEPVHRPVRHQRQRLERLRRRAEEGHQVRVAAAARSRRRVDDRDVDPVRDSTSASRRTSTTAPILPLSHTQ